MEEEFAAVGRRLDARTFLGRDCNTRTSTNVLNINDFLVRKPSERDYPNWEGPRSHRSMSRRLT